jgi:hypothetical protein
VHNGRSYNKSLSRRVVNSVYIPSAADGSHMEEDYLTINISPLYSLHGSPSAADGSHMEEDYLTINISPLYSLHGSTISTRYFLNSFII